MTMREYNKKSIEDLLKLLYKKASAAKDIKTLSITDPYIIAADGKLLGAITTNEYDSNSIFNGYGVYGSKYSGNSIFNEYGTYGSKYSAYSPFNEYTSTPPNIIYQNREIGHLTKNKYLMNSIDPDRLFERIKSELYPNWNQIFNELKY